MNKVPSAEEKCEVYVSDEKLEIEKSRIILCKGNLVYYTGASNEEVNVAITKDNLKSGVEFIELEDCRFNPHHIKPENLTLGGMFGDEWIEIFSTNTKLSSSDLPHIEIYDPEPEDVVSLFNTAWQNAGLNRHVTELKDVLDFVEIQNQNLQTTEPK